MNLCIDIGNTRLKYAFFQQQECIAEGFGLEALEKALQQHRLLRVLYCAVAAEAGLQQLLEKHGLPANRLTAKTPLPFHLSYETPDTLGADRLAVVAGAQALFPAQPCLVISCGTCITYNFLDASGTFAGGAISPGVPMRLRAMHTFTNRLPQAPMATSPQLTGTTTEASLQTGAQLGAALEINGFCERYQQLYPQLRIIMTGGDMPMLLPHLKNSIFARPALALEGLNAIINHES
ncbi:MAG: type III pantothenate kinase [Chitinophagales bacterium]